MSPRPFSSLSSFPSAPSPLLHGNCTGLSVCACMCAPVYTCIERYICGGRGREWCPARTLRTGACHPPSMLGDKRVWAGALLSSLQGRTWMLGSRMGSAATFLKLLLLCECMKWHRSLDDCSKELLFYSASLVGRRVEPLILTSPECCIDSPPLSLSLLARSSEGGGLVGPGVFGT